MPRYLITLEPLPRPGGPSPDRRLAAGLKSLLRRFGLRCTRALETPPVTTVLFILDEEYLCGPMPWEGDLPQVGDRLGFGPEREVVHARVILRTYYPALRRWEINLERDEDEPLSPEDAALWRRAGFAIEDAPEPEPPWKELS